MFRNSQTIHVRQNHESEGRSSNLVCKPDIWSTDYARALHDSFQGVLAIWDWTLETHPTRGSCDAFEAWLPKMSVTAVEDRSFTHEERSCGLLCVPGVS